MVTILFFLLLLLPQVAQVMAETQLERLAIMAVRVVETVTQGLHRLVLELLIKVMQVEQVKALLRHFLLVVVVERVKLVTLMVKVAAEMELQFQLQEVQ
jgi:hypothetical protein